MLPQSFPAELVSYFPILEVLSERFLRFLVFYHLATRLDQPLHQFPVFPLDFLALHSLEALVSVHYSLALLESHLARFQISLGQQHRSNHGWVCGFAPLGAPGGGFGLRVGETQGLLGVELEGTCGGPQVAQVGPDTGFRLTFIAFVVGLVLKQKKLISFVIGTVISQVGHVGLQ